MVDTQIGVDLLQDLSQDGKGKGLCTSRSKGRSRISSNIYIPKIIVLVVMSHNAYLFILFWKLWKAECGCFTSTADPGNAHFPGSGRH